MLVYDILVRDGFAFLYVDNDTTETPIISEKPFNSAEEALAFVREHYPNAVDVATLDAPTIPAGWDKV